jgi:hypothetical protein
MNRGGIHNTSEFKDVTVIKNEILRNSNMSWRAKGLLCYLLSLPPDWVTYKKEVANHATESYDTMIKAFQELENAGYILTTQYVNDKGRFTGLEYHVYNAPTTRGIISPSDSAKTGNRVLQTYQSKDKD